MIDLASNSKANILVVDDTHANLRLLTQILISAGYLVRPVPNGPLAISSVNAALPDIILLDIMMPGMSGYEVCERLKADERTRDIPIMFISALSEVFDKVKAFSVGGVDFIMKPFQTEEVLARVKTHLTLRNLQKTLQEQNIRLQQEIVERKRAEDAVERHNRELRLLNQMYRDLQRCKTEKDTYQIIRDICEPMFPDDCGCVYMIRPGQAELDAVVFWGGVPLAARISDEFEERHTGSLYPIECPPNKLVYLYVDAHTDSSFPCPLRNASGGVLGLLFLQFRSSDSELPEDELYHQIESKQLVATQIVEQYSLFLMNLRLREELRREAIRDPVTGLFNRRYMKESLRQEANRAKRHQTSVGLVMLDIDHFKAVNDTYSHEAGDVVLQELGRLLRRNIRGGDTACRYGGEEFLLILPEIELDGITQRAEKLRHAAKNMQVTYQQRAVSITISCGIAMLPYHGTSIEQVLNAADNALYQAKSNGRDQVVVAPL